MKLLPVLTGGQQPSGEEQSVDCSSPHKKGSFVFKAFKVGDFVRHKHGNIFGGPNVAVEVYTIKQISNYDRRIITCFLNRLDNTFSDYEHNFIPVKSIKYNLPTWF